MRRHSPWREEKFLEKKVKKEEQKLGTEKLLKVIIKFNYLRITKYVEHFRPQKWQKQGKGKE